MVLELQSAAPRRNVKITRRGEVSNPVRNTLPRQNRRRHQPDFRGILTIVFLNFVKSLNSFLINLEFPPEEILNRGTCQTSFKLKYSGYHFSRLDELLYETPQHMKIMKIMKFLNSRPFWLSNRSSEGSGRCAKAQCSNNLQRRGFEL